jgi:hypothetical protein
MAAARTGQKLRQKEVSQHYRISLSTLSQRLTLLKPHANHQQNGPAGVPIQLDDAEWIAVFRATHRLLSQLYTQKTHIEIVRYLRHVELNVKLAGYTISPDRLQEQFSRLFARVGLQPVKGRDTRKFVFLQDLWGRREPFVLLKLGYEDG